MFISGTNIDEAINDDDSCNNISEKIRKLRTNFFDQELKSLEDLKGPSSTDLRFGQFLGTISPRETSKWIDSSRANRNLDPEQYADQTSSTSFDDTYLHLPELTTDRSHVHNARNALLPISNRRKVSDEVHSKIDAEGSVFGTEQSIEEDVTFQHGTVYSSSITETCT